jgi:hypothetical protein
MSATSSPHWINSKDRARVYNPDKQARWHQFSTELINDLSQQFKGNISKPKYKTMHILAKKFKPILPTFLFAASKTKPEDPGEKFARMLIALGTERQRIAQETQQGANGRLAEYGVLRADGYEAMEIFLDYNYDIQSWPSMSPIVFKYADETAEHLLMDFPYDASFVQHYDRFFQQEMQQFIQGNVAYRMWSHEKKTFYKVVDFDNCRTVLVALNNDNPNEKSIFIEHIALSSIHSMDSQDPFRFDADQYDTLARVDVEDPTPGQRHLIIFYHEANVGKYEAEMKAYFSEAQGYLDAMLSVPFGDLNRFLFQTGMFCHLMANLLPFQLGTAGITEWIIRAASHAKGINLGVFNNEENIISWDFKALITPKPGEYAQWFQQHAFANPQVMTDPGTPFSYVENPIGSRLNPHG